MLFRISALVLIAVCITAFGYFIASAQDNVQRVEKVGNGDVYIIDAEAPKDGSKPEVQVFIKSENGETVIIPAGEGGGKNSTGKRSKQQGVSAENRDTMKGQSPEGMKDPEAMRKMREKQNIGKEQTGTSAPQGESPQPQQNQPQGQASPDSGLQRYINVIVNKNLFMPLGFSRKEQKQSYVLTGVVSGESGKNDRKAIIEQASGQRSYYVSQGDTVDDTKVTEINEWQVKMDRSGEQMTLKLGEGTHSGAMQGSRGGGGEGQKGSSGGKKGESRTDKPAGVSGGDNFNPDDIPPFVKQMLEQQGISIEDLKNNPDLREKIKQQFQQKFGGREAEGGQGKRGGRDN